MAGIGTKAVGIGQRLMMLWDPSCMPDGKKHQHNTGFYDWYCMQVGCLGNEVISWFSA